MQRFNFEKELCQHQRRCEHNWTSSKQKRKNQSLSMILEDESDEDSAIFKKERSTHHMDMMGHGIHVLHNLFIFIFWNYLFLECVDDVLPSSLWSSNYSGFPLKEKEVASHQEREQLFDKEKQEEESQLELSPTFSTLESER